MCAGVASSPGSEAVYQNSHSSELESCYMLAEEGQGAEGWLVRGARNLFEDESVLSPQVSCQCQLEPSWLCGCVLGGARYHSGATFPLSAGSYLIKQGSNPVHGQPGADLV